MKSISIISAFLIVIMPSLFETAAAGNDTIFIKPGEPARILAPGYAEKYNRRRQQTRPLTGVIDTMYSNSIVFNGEDAEQSLEIPLGAIEKLEIRGKCGGKNILHGAGIGFLSGLVLGGAIGLLSPKEHDMSQGSVVLFFAGILGGGGLIIGAGIGALMPPSDCWKGVDPRKLHLTPARQPVEGLTLQVTISF